MPVRGMTRLRNRLQRGKRTLNREADASTRRAAQAGVATGKQHIIEQDAVASTELFRSMNWQRVHGDFRGAASVLFNDAPYARFVDEGTGSYGPWPAGDPGPFVIKRWMEMKPSFVEPADPLVKWAVAEEIAGNIRESGTKPRPFWDSAVDVAGETLLNGMRTAVERF